MCYYPVMAISAEYQPINKHGNTPDLPKPLNDGRNSIPVGQRAIEVGFMPLSEMIVVTSGSGIAMSVLEDPDRQVYKFTDNNADTLTLKPGETAILDYTAPGFRATTKQVLVKTSEEKKRQIFKQTAQRLHDYYVGLQRKGKLGEEDIPNYRIAMDREMEGIVKPIHDPQPKKKTNRGISRKPIATSVHSFGLEEVRGLQKPLEYPTMKLEPTARFHMGEASDAERRKKLFGVK